MTTKPSWLDNILDVGSTRIDRQLITKLVACSAIEILCALCSLSTVQDRGNTASVIMPHWAKSIFG